MSVESFPPAAVAHADRETRVWWNLAAAALLLRFLIMPYGGFPVDIGTFRAWATGLAENGPAAFYGAGFADYLPGYLYVLWAIGEINQVVSLSDQAFVFALKLPAAVCDIAAAWVVFALARRMGSRWALLLSASYLFNPGIVFNSAYWGQADAVGALFALSGVALLGVASPLLTAVLLTVAALIKPQTAPVMIPTGLYLARALARPVHGPPRWDLLLGAAAVAAAALVLIILPFGLSPLGLIGVLRVSLGVYPYSSVVAFNFWGATQGFWVGDDVRWLGVQLYAYGTAAAAVALAVVAVGALRRPTLRGTILACSVALLATFVLPTRIHERYLLTAIPFFAVAAAADRRMVGVYAVLSVVFALNLLFAYTRPYVQTFALPGWLESTVFSTVGTRALSVAAVLAFLAALWILFTQAREPVCEGNQQHHRGDSGEVGIGGPSGEEHRREPGQRTEQQGAARPSHPGQETGQGHNAH
ncbi:MAG: hypothetical protein RDU83_12770 [bacterium]|nr:hypothetical protein [bacterium]